MMQTYDSYTNNLSSDQEATSLNMTKMPGLLLLFVMMLLLTDYGLLMDLDIAS